MIDLIVNDNTLTVVHDEPALDVVERLSVSRSDGAARLVSSGLTRHLASVHPRLISRLREEMVARLVRMDGISIAKVGSIILELK